MMSFGRPPRPAHAASTTPAAANAIAQPQQEPAASLKDALADAEKRVQELRKIWQASQAAASVLQKETMEAGTQTSPRPAARRTRAPSPLVLPDGRAGSLEARVHAACMELLTPGAQRHPHDSLPSSTVGKTRSFGQRTAGGCAAECVADSLQQAMMETPAGARPAWLRSHRLETPLSSTSIAAPFSAYRHSSRMAAESTAASEACTPPPRTANTACGTAAAGSGDLQLLRHLDQEQQQQQQLLVSHIDDVALGVPMEPMFEAFTPHTSAMRLRAAMQWMRLQLGAVAVAGGGGVGADGAGNGASQRRAGRQRRYSDSSVSPALKILLGASAAAPPAAGNGVAAAAEYEASDGASEGCIALEQQLEDLEADELKGIAGLGAAAALAAHTGTYGRASMGGGGAAVDLLMSGEADVEADVFCLNPLFDGQQRRTEGGAPGRCIAPWQAGSPDKEPSSDSDDFGPYCGPAVGVLPFAAAAAVAGQSAALTTVSTGLGVHAIGGVHPMGLVSAAPAACVGTGGLGGGGGVLRDISHGLNLASRLAPAAKGSAKVTDNGLPTVWR